MRPTTSSTVKTIFPQLSGDKVTKIAGLISVDRVLSQIVELTPQHRISADIWLWAARPNGSVKMNRNKLNKQTLLAMSNKEFNR